MVILELASHSSPSPFAFEKKIFPTWFYSLVIFKDSMILKFVCHFSEDKDSDGKEKKSKLKEKDKKKEPASMFQINGEKDSKSKKKGDNIFDKL